jgi:RNA polymerase sigma-70 factor (ECF subfamily)
VSEDDRQLVARMLAGEQAAFERFFAAYARRLAAFIARRTPLQAAEIEDTVQTTLIKAIRNLRAYRGEAALYTWLCTICRSELADARRKAARQPPHQSTDSDSSAQAWLLELAAPVTDEPHTATERAAHGDAVVAVLTALPERYALALEWKYGDGFSVEEIAGMLDLTVAAAQSLLARARNEFKQRWVEGGPS